MAGLKSGASAGRSWDLAGVLAACWRQAEHKSCETSFPYAAYQGARGHIFLAPSWSGFLELA